MYIIARRPFYGDMAGAFLTIGAASAVSNNICSGADFIALAAVIFGRWSHRGAVGAALLPGFADALSTVLSFIQIPVVIRFMPPHFATYLAVAALVGRVRAPATDGGPSINE